MKRDRPANEFAEELFRLAVEACPNGMLMTDSSGTIVLVNGETERLAANRRPRNRHSPKRQRHSHFALRGRSGCRHGGA
ncbi:MAG TPA: hypothetical protein VHD86_21475 [Xanthobacteraceae bacterium]|nr:hypothetical protein [Xanthobacteraceae bacterium]